MTEHVACLTCGEVSSAFFIDAEDDLTGRPGRFTFVKCACCGLVYQEPRLTLEAIRPFYDTEYIAHQESRRWGLLAPLFAAERVVGEFENLERQVPVADRHVVRDHVLPEAGGEPQEELAVLGLDPVLARGEPVEILR